MHFPSLNLICMTALQYPRVTFVIGTTDYVLYCVAFLHPQPQSFLQCAGSSSAKCSITDDPNKTSTQVSSNIVDSNWPYRNPTALSYHMNQPRISSQTPCSHTNTTSPATSVPKLILSRATAGFTSNTEDYSCSFRSFSSKLGEVPLGLHIRYQWDDHLLGLLHLWNC